MSCTHYVLYFNGHGEERLPFDSYEQARKWIAVSTQRAQERSDRFRKEGTTAGEESRRL